MKRKYASFILAVLLVCGLLPMSALGAEITPVTATPTSSSVHVDSETATMFPVYSIDGNNYFKLRDLAYMLSGTKKQFEVAWDGANNTIILTSGKPYTIVSGEMAPKSGVYKSAILTDSKIYLDGTEVQFTAYNIEGNNYFKLHDVGKALNFSVDWDSVGNAIIIDTGKVYADTVSPLQNQLMSYLSELFAEVYTPYYGGLHYEISNYEETVIDSEYTATFCWTMFHLDNGLDVPSDFGKEQEANWSLRATIQIKDDGQLDTTTAVVLADNSATGPPTYQVPIKDYFPISVTDLHLEDTIGVDVLLDYEDDNIIVFHGYFGLFIYDLKKEQITFSSDLEKAVGSTLIQGSEGAAVSVSADGKTVQLYFYPEAGKPEKAYYIDTDSLTYTYKDYVPVESVFDRGGTKGQIICIGDTGTIGELHYLRDGKERQLFASPGSYGLVAD